ncbi:hypothetical protein P9112_005442 [Eukaryota sp. TZLM1-RC]
MKTRFLISEMLDIPPFEKSWRWQSLCGGCINDVYRVHTPCETVVVKVNEQHQYPGMFEAEAKGLNLLSSYLSVPKVIQHGASEGKSYLVLQDLGSGRSEHDDTESSVSLGRELAHMHKTAVGTVFGLDHNNYIGSLKQNNREHATWPTFFEQQRLRPLVEQAMSLGRLTSEDARLFEQLYIRLPDLFPEEPPCLVHGDLWGGNVHGCFFIDPAVYYGCREMDIAMTLLFGGFSSSFYNAYESIHPLTKGWMERVDLCNIYPNLVHLVLFGTGYRSSIRAALKKYCR